jgi:cytochrome c2
MLIIIGCTSNSSTVTNTSAATSASSSTVADGKTLLDSRCSSCHTLAQVVNRTGSFSQWQGVVDQMIQRGAVLNSDEEKVLVQYLADNFK